MRYKVHQIEVNKHTMQDKLDRFINSLNGEVISVFPNVTPTFQPMGATAKVTSIFIVEKVMD